MRTTRQTLIIVAVGCLLTLPLLIYGISIQSDDGATHVVWYTNFSNQFWAGDHYPRWLADLNDGLGSPAFFYYPPIPDLLTSLLKPLFPGDVNGVHQLGISAAVSVILSGIFVWLWTREIVDDVSAMVAGIAFMVTPYHLLIDVYTRTAFAEVWSFAWIPLVLLFVHRVARGGRIASVGLAIAYALLIATHLPTTLLFSIVPMVYAWFAAKRGRKARTLAAVAISMAAGTGLACIYLYPAMMMQDHVFVGEMSLGHFSYSNWLFFSNFYYQQDVDLRPVYGTLFVFLDLVIMIGGIFFVLRKSEETSERRSFTTCWTIIGLGAFLMTTDISRPLWMLVPTIQRVQFPFRFGVVISVAAAALVAVVAVRLRDSSIEAMDTGKLLVLFCLFVWLPLAAWGLSFYATPVKADDVGFKEKIIRERREQPEYRPRWSQTMAAIDWNASTDEDAWADSLEREYESLIERTGARDPAFQRIVLTSGTGKATVAAWQPRQILVHTELPAAATVRVSQFYFPEWQAKLADSGEVLNVRPTVPDGLVSIEVPAGIHDVALQLATADAEKTGRLITLLSLVCVAAYALIIGVLTVRKK